MYPLALKLHLAFTVLSLVIFLIRFALSVKGSALSENRLLLLGTLGSMLMVVLTAGALVVTTGQYPGATGWVTEKLISLVLYIGFAITALKLKGNVLKQIVFGAIALAAFSFTLMVARQHAGFFL